MDARRAGGPPVAAGSGWPGWVPETGLS